MQEGTLSPESLGFLDKMWHMRNNGATNLSKTGINKDNQRNG